MKADGGSVEGANWEKTWQRHEMSRLLYRKWSASPKPGWVEVASDGLAGSDRSDRSAGFTNTPPAQWWVYQDKASGWILARREEWFRQLLSMISNNWQGRSDHLGFNLSLASRELGTMAWNQKGALESFQQGSGMFTMASSEDESSPQDRLQFQVFLAHPDKLYSRQRQRTFWFGLVVGLSALAALIGVAATVTAYQRQVKLNQLKSNFVSAVSHELRAPIASIRLMAESLERGRVKSEDKQNEYFHFIVRECRRLGSLIQNVLDYARIEQSRKQYEFEPVDMTGLIRQTVQGMEPCAQEKQVTLQIQGIPLIHSNASPDSPPDPDFKKSPIVLAPVAAEVDGRALQQALINLLDNAIKHAPAGSKVEIGCQATPLGRLLLWVQDHGPGIAQEEHKRIFEWFYRSGTELRRNTQGVGIGLSIVKHIVEAHRREPSPSKASRIREAGLP